MSVTGEQIVMASHDADTDALPSGTKLLNGQYVIEDYLSSGGFGITYLARDSLDRRVVIKECYPEALCNRKAKTVRARSSGHLSEFRSLVKMFVREARSIAKLNHPNIVGVHQVFEDNETAYMALDLIEGRDLLHIIEEGKIELSPSIIESLLRKLLNAISTVHEVDMLHRDIAPDNILLDPWGNPILIDFGAAREEASKKSRAISALLVVKDGYSPQEFYISGGKQGPSSDLYSLGATFFHIVSGEAPPNSQNRLAALASKRPDPYPSLEGRIEGYEPAFLRAIDQAMNVFPQDRIQTADEWLGLIDANQTAAKARRIKESDEELRHILSDLVQEVDAAIVEDRETQEAASEYTAVVAPTEPEKVWEYLLPEDDDAASTVTLDDEPHKSAWRDRWRPAVSRFVAQMDTRRSMQRCAAWTLVGAVGFNIHDNPTSNVATLAGPEVLQLIGFARDLTTRTAQLLTTTL